MPRTTEKFDPPLDFKVFIRNPQGKYLAADDNGLFFSQDRTGALILNYRGDQVEAQLETIRRVHGLNLVPDPVPPEEIYETCDRCKELFLPLMTFFDGKSFLCQDCRKRRGAARS
jgi:hypothetical protein